MAASIYKLGHVCSAAAALGDVFAVATPDCRLVIYRRSSGPGILKLDKIAELEGHEATISGLHFHSSSGSADSIGGGENRSSNGTGSAPTPLLRLVSSSHDRNSYVFLPAGSSPRWQPELVVTRLHKAGLCCCWSPCGRKYAIGGSERVVDVLYWAADKELWAPKLIKDKHGSAVMAVAWHPSGTVLATVSTDSKLRLFNAFVPGVDDGPHHAALSASRFGDCLTEVPLPGGWGLAVAFSPGGATVAAASQGSQLTLLTGLDLGNPATLDAAAAAATGRLQHLQLPALPLKCLAFLSDSLLAGGGFDFNPQLFARQAYGEWRHAATLQGVKSGSQAGRSKAPSLSARIKHFEQQAAAASSRGARGTAADDAGSSDRGSSTQLSCGPHQNCIISLAQLPAPAPGTLAFLTASLEGCLAEWHVNEATVQAV